MSLPLADLARPFIVSAVLASSRFASAVAMTLISDSEPALLA